MDLTKHYVIGIEELHALIGYLKQRPYAEVAGALPKLAQLPTVEAFMKPIEVEKEKASQK